MGRKHLCIIHQCDPDLRSVSKMLLNLTEGDEVILAGICDAREEELLSRQMSDRSFVGLKLREEITAFTCDLAEETTQSLLETATTMCETQGYSPHVLSRNGGFLELIHHLASDCEPTTIFMPRLEQGLFSKLWRGNRTDAVVSSLRYPVVVC